MAPRIIREDTPSKGVLGMGIDEDNESVRRPVDAAFCRKLIREFDATFFGWKEGRIDNVTAINSLSDFWGDIAEVRLDDRQADAVDSARAGSLREELGVCSVWAANAIEAAERIEDRQYPCSDDAVQARELAYRDCTEIRKTHPFLR